MQKINENPARYKADKTVTKKSLFGKKETTKYAVCDENQLPLSEFDYDAISQYDDGFALAQIKTSIHYIDLNGQIVLKTYVDKGCDIKRMGDLFQITQHVTNNKGLAYRDGTVLIEPGNEQNYMEIIEDVVIYGNLSPVGFDYRKLGAAKVVGGRLVPVVPCNYNYVQYLDDRLIAAGRYSIKKETTMGLFQDEVKTTATPAFQLYSVDTGKVSDLVFGEIHKTSHGNYSAVIFPQVRPDELTYRQQTFKEAFNGEGLLDLRVKKNVVLNERFEFPK